MNEIEKAIKDLKEYIQLWEDEQADEDLTVIIYKNTIESFKIAKQALEKQIPKKPKKAKDGTLSRCPFCEAFVGSVGDYCYLCGQAIDWSGEVEE